jgi:two-component system, LytTR family, response regulator
MIKAAIVDDEVKSILILKKMLNDHCPGIDVIIESKNIKDACAMIKEKRPQLLFLDVEMSEGTGFDLLEQFDDPFFYVVFVTAHSNYAVKAFKFSAVDYILKPIDASDLVLAVEKAIKIIRENKKDGKEISFLNIRTKQGSLYIKPATIMRIQAENSYSRVFVSNGESYVLSYNLGTIEDDLDRDMFLRVHKSAIINISFLKTFHATGNLHVEMTDGSMVPVSRRSKKSVENRLKGLAE